MSTRRGESAVRWSRAWNAAKALRTDRPTPMPRILVIDDDETLLALLERSLMRAGYDVLTTSDGQDARRLVAREAFDVVITDMVMPQPDGFEMLAELRRTCPATRVIAVSGNPRMAEIYLRAARCLGAVSMLQKPFRFEHLLGTIERLTTPPSRRAEA